MKKIVFFLFLFISFLSFVSAKDLILQELTVKNGKLSIPFESLNNEYTVLLEKEETNLELDYKVDDKVQVLIKDNFDLKNNSVVTILLKENKKEVEYHLQILKEDEEEIKEVFLEEKAPTKMNIMFAYKNYIIPSVCFVFIFIFWKILFHKKHKK